MVNECSDRNAICQLRRSTDVVHMEVRDQDIVNLADTGLFCRRHNAIGVTAIKARPSGVNQQRLPGWRDKQCRLPAFDIHEVELQGLTGSR